MNRHRHCRTSRLFAIAWAACNLTLTAQTARATVIDRILIPAESTRAERNAARALSKHLKSIFGKQFPTAPYMAETDKNGAILVGRAAVEGGLVSSAALQRLGPDGYCVVSDGNTVGIAGDGGAGVVFGGYAFLRKIGLKIYAVDCVVVPRLARLEVPAFQLSDTPAFEFRNSRRLHQELGFTPRLQCSNPREVDPKAGRSWDHTHNYQIPLRPYYKEHPEYFAKNEQGHMLKTRGPGQLHLCFSHPDVRRIASDRVMDWVNKTPHGKFYCVTQGDGAAWCRCPNCTANDPEPDARWKRYSMYLADRLLDYVNPIANRVAAKHPDKMILTFAYTPSTQQPPRRLKPAPNVRVMFAPYPFPGWALCSSHDLFCKQNKGALKDLRGWLAWCPDNVYIYDYVHNFRNRYEPFGCLYGMVDKIKFYHQHGIKGIHFCGGHPLLFGALFEYVIGRMLWHPELDPEPLINEFMPAYYGAAAPYMRQYFDLFYGRIRDKTNPFHQRCTRPNPGLVTPAFAARAYPIFERAKRAVRNDPTRLKRVEFDELTGVLWADLNENTKEKLISKGTVNRRLLAKFRQLAHVCEEHRVPDFVAKTRPKVWIKKIFGLAVDTQPWWNDPTVEKLLAGKLTAAELRVLEQSSLQKTSSAGSRRRRKAGLGDNVDVD